jgi:hypothetical protein
MSGSGDGTVELSALEHTGRVQRSGTVTITGTGVATPETVAVTQAAKTEFVQFTNNATEIAAAAAGGNVSLTGTSNSSKLTWAAVGTATDENGQTVNPETGLDYPEVAAPTDYTANGAAATSGTDIAGDPGADAEFEFSATLVIPENTSTVRVDRTYSITDNAGNSVQIVVKQAAGAATLSVAPSSISITAAGVASDDITVTSNTSWTVS